MTVIVSGNVLKNCRRFAINFQSGRSQVPLSDIAFHFNVRFDQKCVVCNSHEKGGWQYEERNYDMVFRKGHPFEIRFLVNDTSYVVFIDGRQYLEFKHRIAFSQVDTIAVSGALDMVSINIQDSTTEQ
ncbi:galectin-9 [Liasis olivaceus]